jgi:hypothetical protein
LVTLIIFGEAYKLRSSSLCHLFQPPAISSLHVQIFSSALSSQEPSIYVLSWSERLSFTPIQKTGKVMFFNIF